MGRGRPRKNNTSAMVITAGGKVRTDKRNDPVGKMKEKAELEEELNSELEWPEVQVNRSFHSSPVGSAIAGLRTEHTVYQDTLYKVRACSTTLGGDLIVEKEIGESSKAQEQNRINTGGQRAWAGLFDANCLTAKGMNLTYIPPIIEEGEVMVQLEREDVVEGNTKWKQALIMYVVGNTPTIGAVERFVAAQWKFVQISSRRRMLAPQIWRKIICQVTRRNGRDAALASPHVVMGDFNTILRSDDRVMGSQVIDSEVMDFNNFIQDTGLMELKRNGLSVGICVDPQLSDHSPLCIELEQQVVSGTKPFRFYNYLAEHEQILQEVQTA
ncbi:hypothetical protein T459_03641 [Capsicum annuum]|uniref:Endonuclease/exonuclease/phosphatase domain-containing protein n=1 Tax=Capsicum annuum TaxID=4072 RepID=A0A2G3ANF6_CAPAN|nr:hypothetical protein T459_03641 [Capsicum annuum]